MRPATVRTETHGYRRMTQAEVSSWYKMAEGWGPHDSAGESWVCSGITRVQVPAGTVVDVLRLRSAAHTGWGATRPGYSLVALPDGTQLHIPRAAHGM